MGSGVLCAVFECKNRSSMKEKKPNLILHRFPIQNVSLCKKWAYLCKRKDKLNFKSAYICSEHFSKESYSRDLKNELLGLPLLNRLLPDAIPTVFSGRIQKTDDYKRVERTKTRERQRLIKNLLNNELSSPFPEVISPDDSSKIEAQELQEMSKVPVVEYLRDKLRRQQSRNHEAFEEINRLKLRLRQKSKKLKDALRRNRHLHKIFSPSQQRMLTGKKRVRWSTQDIVKALSLRSVSIKSYETARSCWGIPLPSVRCLQNYSRRFQCNEGILKDVIDIMKVEAPKMNVWKRISVLSFDEMNINSSSVLDKSKMEIVTASKVQVIMARGICDNWKQPIYFSYDTRMTPEILKNVILELERAGYPVHAVVSDLGADNYSLWSKLKISTETTFFKNPAEETRIIHVFADVPHLAKLLRNHLLDDQAKLPDGTIINKQVFSDLIQFDSAEVKLCPKLNYKLIEVTGAERMRVRPAMQLLSHHVASLAKIYYKEKPGIGKFIEIVNNGFDVLNSRVPVDTKNTFKSALGFNLQNQLTALNQLKYVIQNTKFYTKSGNEKSTLHIFQKGFLISVSSIINLFFDLKILYGVKYLLTSRCNQDCLESLFSRIRAYGGQNTNPTPPEFKYRLRLLLLGSKIKGPTGTNTTENFESCQWISSELIKRCSLQAKASSDSSSSDSDPDSSSLLHYEMPSEDAIQYLAGYLAFRLKRKGYNYGSPTSSMTGSSWIFTLSRGGLLKPNNELLISVKECERVFNQIVSVKNSNKMAYSYIYSSMIQMLGSINPVILREYLLLRMKIRVKYINNLCRTKSLLNRKKKRQFLQSSINVMK